MQHDDKIVRLTGDLTNAVNRAYAGGVEANDIINCLTATVAAIAISDGASSDGVAALFRHVANHYQRATVSSDPDKVGMTRRELGQHQAALSQATAP